MILACEPTLEEDRVVPEIVSSSTLARQPCVRHGFFTRRGGVSQGIYASLNCGPGSGDDPDRVMENRERVMGALGIVPQALCTLSQIHSAEVIHLKEPLASRPGPKADAMVTSTAGVALGVLAADCVPVLLADDLGTVVGAAHAGWKGALAGIVEATVAAMGALGAAPETIAACIGPAIQQRSYEVGTGLRRRLLDERDDNERLFESSRRDGHFHFDLPQYVQGRLEAAGVAVIERMPWDTYSDELRFFSYRRSCHSAEPDYGRLLSVIALA